MLAERRNLHERQPCLRPLPIQPEIVDVDRGPFDHQGESAWREPAGDDLMRSNRDDRLGSGVTGMEVGRQVVIDVHLDHDAEEARDLGHVATVVTMAYRSLTCGLPGEDC